MRKTKLEAFQFLISNCNIKLQSSKYCDTGIETDNQNNGRELTLRDKSTHIGSVQFSHSVVSDSATQYTAAGEAFLSITNSWSLLRLMPNHSVMPSNCLIPLSSRLQSFPASGSFPIIQFFALADQSIRVSLVLPMNVQD